MVLAVPVRENRGILRRLLMDERAWAAKDDRIYLRELTGIVQ